MDVAIIERARQGDADAFAAIYEYYSTAIHRYAYRMLGNPEQADDLTQETFIRAYQSLSRLDQDPNLSAWLYRIASNACLDALRRRQRITWLPMLDRSERDAEFTTDDFAPQVVEADVVRRVLAEMPAPLSMTLVLRSSEGFSCEEIAEIMNVPKGTVFSRLARAREQFTRLYARAGREEKG
ncbi:MAG TPA: sigma-70 family RNA polymerase sigma factor [Chloroflexia bacterium]|nr:sigma-70 family RNA polymerase sigma factor [Chloroflexia bacterium]